MRGRRCSPTPARRVDDETAQDVVAEALLVLWRRRHELSRSGGPDASAPTRSPGRSASPAAASPTRSGPPAATSPWSAGWPASSARLRHPARRRRRRRRAPCRSGLAPQGGPGAAPPVGLGRPEAGTDRGRPRHHARGGVGAAAPRQEATERPARAASSRVPPRPRTDPPYLTKAEHAMDPTTERRLRDADPLARRTTDETRDQDWLSEAARSATTRPPVAAAARRRPGRCRSSCRAGRRGRRVRPARDRRRQRGVRCRRQRPPSPTSPRRARTRWRCAWPSRTTPSSHARRVRRRGEREDR